MNGFPRLDILPAAQRALWPQLADVTRNSFVLYGGTAIALHLGHRISVDFDFFSHLPFQPEALMDQLPCLQGAEVLQSNPSTLTVITAGRDAQGVKMSFFGGLKFGRLAALHATPDKVMRVASTADLLAHKLKTVLQRVEVKDYIDIDALIHSGQDLSTALAGAALLFPAFAPQECLKALTYFEDAGLHELPPPTEERLLASVRQVRGIPRVSLVSTSLAE